VDIAGQHVVVTGGGNGIGAALATRFAADGAIVTVADVDGTAALAVSESITRGRGIAAAVTADVGSEEGNIALLAAARAAHGPIDLFFANAGIGRGTDPMCAESDWDASFNVNVHAHRWAARHLLPEWLDRGAGYFCSTASAAGLLAQIGSAPYSVTKHAALSFAEWLSITYGDRGIRVSCLCPQGVNTNMLREGDDPTFGPSSNVVRAAGAVLEPHEVADVVAAAVADERFLILPHPEVQTYLERKATDRERWLAGMRRLNARATSAQ
jgi:NAD(P)-dependent dehydrogenase (short-subunit alcohol dehydrogenase family)